MVERIKTFSMHDPMTSPPFSLQLSPYHPWLNPHFRAERLYAVFCAKYCEIQNTMLWCWVKICHNILTSASWLKGGFGYFPVRSQTSNFSTKNSWNFCTCWFQTNNSRNRCRLYRWINDVFDQSLSLAMDVRLPEIPLFGVLRVEMGLSNEQKGHGCFLIWIWGYFFVLLWYSLCFYFGRLKCMKSSMKFWHGILVIN